MHPNHTTAGKASLGIALAFWALVCSGQPRLTERRLADVAVVAVPAPLDSEDQQLTTLVAPSKRTAADSRVHRDDLLQRLAFGFSSTYLWASMGSGTVYRQQLVVSLMASDDTDADYASLPSRMAISYEGRKPLGSRALGSGTLTVSEGLYQRGGVSEPALQFVYADRSRRLQLVWHVVKKEVDLETGVVLVARMAASFRIVRDPVDWFAERRAAPQQEAALRARRLATVQATLKREGLWPLQPGQAVLHKGVYMEWMDSPEPRYQLLLPLGRVRSAAPGQEVNRPRPVKNTPAPATAGLPGTVGWREFSDGEWTFSNAEHDYLPFKGIAARLAARQQDRVYTSFYYAATVRVEEVHDERRLQSLNWFLDSLPEVQKRWREAALVAPGLPEQE